MGSSLNRGPSSDPAYYLYIYIYTQKKVRHPYIYIYLSIYLSIYLYITCDSRAPIQVFGLQEFPAWEGAVPLTHRSP